MLVEARRVELLSENRIEKASPSAADVLGFPLPGPRPQGPGIGILIDPACRKD